MKRWIWILPLSIVVVLGVWYLLKAGNSKHESTRSVRVTRGTVTRKATAAGRIEVDHETAVNSTTGGVLTKLYVKLGQRVHRGDPLAEVRPTATTLTLLNAERGLEAARDQEEQAQEYLEGKHLAALVTRLVMGRRNIERMNKYAAMARRQAEEQLELLRKGEVVIEDRNIDFIVRAPVDGHVLQLNAREGAPVVPASSYGTGTVLMILADMGRLVFRGTVDEIDVGRLKEGMPARVKIGALPGEPVKGTLTEIAMKARIEDNAVVFPVRVDLEAPESLVLRSGYSAVAEIELGRREDVPILPERAVEFRGGEAFVQVPDGRGGRKEKPVETGLSDGLTVEVLSGLAEGEEVLERVYE